MECQGMHCGNVQESWGWALEHKGAGDKGGFFWALLTRGGLELPLLYLEDSGEGE